MTTLDTADKSKEIRVVLMCASAVRTIRPNSESAKVRRKVFLFHRNHHGCSLQIQRPGLIATDVDCPNSRIRVVAVRVRFSFPKDSKAAAGGEPEAIYYATCIYLKKGGRSWWRNQVILVCHNGQPRLLLRCYCSYKGPPST